MSKASDAKTLPEVANKGSGDSSQVYDFLQSDDWQQMLEKARIQREKNLSARKQGGKENPLPEANQHKTDHSTNRERTAGPRHPLDRLEAARQQRERVLASRAAKAEERERSESDADGGEKPGTPLETQQQEKKPSGARRQNQKQIAPEAVPLHAKRSSEDSKVSVKWPPVGIPVRDSTSKGDQQDQSNSGQGASLPSVEANKKLRRKLLRSWVNRQQPLKARVGSVVLGCAIGVIASSSTFYVLSAWGPGVTRESVGLGSSDAELAESAALQGKEIVQSEPLQPDAPTIAESRLANTPNLSEPSAVSIAPDGNLEGGTILAAPRTQPVAPDVRSDLLAFDHLWLPTIDLHPQAEPIPSFVRYNMAPKIITAASLLPPELTESPAQVQPNIRRVAPNVRSSLASIEQPQTSVVTSGVQTRQEAAPGFALNHKSPELSGTAMASSDEVAIKADRSDFLAAAIAKSPRPPDVTIQLASLTSGEEHKPLQKQAPSPNANYVTPARPGFSTTVPLAVLGYVDPPKVSNPADSISTGLTTAAIDPLIETEDVAPTAEGTLPGQLNPMAKPAEAISSATTRNTDVEAIGSVSGSGGAEFKLFAPGSLSVDAVDSVVASLVSTGHDFGGTARVGFGISQSNVRFYHKQDAAQAAALAKDAGAVLRDFTGSKTKTPSGIVELWLAGKSVTKPKAKAKTVRRRASPENQVNQLRRQVLSKLKTANQ
ncbi:hypothetical protein [Ruegeria lacuscaerulensis]|uniref:hypothetical protein n=1 Tax=Ruegeria lacuscaerulensis TaxID=55218 RepID=UPI00147CE1A8|nr:hypothetical protein [Ruegeria lacuscaerulensis]